MQRQHFVRPWTVPFKRLSYLSFFTRRLLGLVVSYDLHSSALRLNDVVFVTLPERLVRQSFPCPIINEKFLHNFLLFLIGFNCYLCSSWYVRPIVMFAWLWFFTTSFLLFWNFCPEWSFECTSEKNLFGFNLSFLFSCFVGFFLIISSWLVLILNSLHPFNKGLIFSNSSRLRFWMIYAKVETFDSS